MKRTLFGNLLFDSKNIFFKTKISSQTGTMSFICLSIVKKSQTFLKCLTDSCVTFVESLKKSQTPTLLGGRKRMSLFGFLPFFFKKVKSQKINYNRISTFHISQVRY
jgi:hypothetical protein